MRICIDDNTQTHEDGQYTAPIRFSIGHDMKIGDRVEAEMRRRGWSEGELARRAAITQPTVHRIIKGESKNPRQDNVQAIAKAFGCSAEWLWTGIGKPPTGAILSAEPSSAADKVQQMLERVGKGLTAEARHQILQAVTDTISENTPPTTIPDNVITADFSRRPLVGDEIRIAHYDVQGAMGGGKVVHDFPEMFRDVTVSQQHLRELGVTYKDPSHLKLISGSGESMSPKINHLDPLIVDASIRDFNGDGVYAFAWQGLFYIKTLQMLDAEHFNMLSANPDYPPQKIRIDETYIQAKVLLVWNAKRV